MLFERVRCVEVGRVERVGPLWEDIVIGCVRKSAVTLNEMGETGRLITNFGLGWSRVVHELNRNCYLSYAVSASHTMIRGCVW